MVYVFCFIKSRYTSHNRWLSPYHFSTFNISCIRRPLTFVPRPIVGPTCTPLKTGCFEGESGRSCDWGCGGSAIAGQPGFFDSDERLKALSAAGDPLERLSKVVDFEVFRGELEAALSHSNRAKGGRPPYDPVLMFKVLMFKVLDAPASACRGAFCAGIAAAAPGARDRRAGVRLQDVLDPRAHPGPGGIAADDRDNTASAVWADTAYRSAANLGLLGVADAAQLVGRPD